MQILLNNSIEAYFLPSNRLVCCSNGDIRNYKSFLGGHCKWEFQVKPQTTNRELLFSFFKKMARGNPTYNHMFILCRWAKCIQITYNKHFIKLIYSNKLFYFKVCDLLKLSKYRIIIYKRSPTLCPPLK